MNRPAPIDSLDALDQEVADFLDQHIATLDAYKDLLDKRAAGYNGIRRTENAILTLGYDVIKADGTRVPHNESILGDRGYSAEADEEAARERANPPIDVEEPGDTDPVDPE